MRKLLSVIVLLGFTVMAHAQKFEPNTKWPYVYEHFTPGTIYFEGNEKSSADMNIHLWGNVLHYVKADGKIYRAEAVDEEILTAVDKTVDKLESQIRRQKTKFLKKKKDYPQIVNFLEEDNGADFDYEYEPEDKKITRRKTFELRPMTSEDAILQMEMLGHNFLVYLDAETDSVCVIYKRNDGNYGLLEPDY